MQQKIRLANGYTFNRVINGCWQLSAEHNLQGKTDVDDALQGFHELVEHGFTTFDCADIYTGVEEIIGRFVNELKATGHYQEEDIQVHTKFVPDKSMLSKVDRKYVERIIDRSLQRMHREAIDLVQFHWWDFNVAGMMDTAFELARLQKKGKIRNIGMCNMDTERLKQMVDAGINVVSNQAQYSLFDRRPERSLLKYNVVTQYILNQPGVGAVMIGTRSSRHVADNLRTLEFELSADEMQAIREFIAQYPTPAGECYELERTSPRYQGIILTDLDH